MYRRRNSLALWRESTKPAIESVTQLRLSSTAGKPGTHLAEIFSIDNFLCKIAENCTVPCDMPMASTRVRPLTCILRGYLKKWKWASTPPSYDSKNWYQSQFRSSFFPDLKVEFKSHPRTNSSLVGRRRAMLFWKNFMGSHGENFSALLA